MDAIYHYLEDLERTIDVFFTSVVINSVGLIGLRGLSATGTSAQNFTKGFLAVGGGTTAAWRFTYAEMDATYMIFVAPSHPPSCVLQSMVRSTTQVLFTFSPTVASGVRLDLILVR